MENYSIHDFQSRPHFITKTVNHGFVVILCMEIRDGEKAAFFKDERNDVTHDVMNDVTCYC